MRKYLSYISHTAVIPAPLQNKLPDRPEPTCSKYNPKKPIPPTTIQSWIKLKKEINTNHRPALKNDVQDFDKYDIIFVGSPNWWSTIAPPVATFLERHDFSGKTIVPFMTHGGGRFGHSISDMKKLCPDASFLEGLAIRDSYVNDNCQDVVKWLQTLKLLK